MQPDIEALTNTNIFADLPEDMIARLATRVQHRHFEKGDVVFQAGDPGNALYIVEAGEVKISMLSASKQQITLALLSPGDAFGELSLLDGEPRSATASAEAKTRCLYLRREDFLDLFAQERASIQAVLISLTRLLRRSNERLADVLLNPNVRVSKALLELADSHGKPIPDGYFVDPCPGGILIDRPVDADDLASLTGLYAVEVRRILRDYQFEAVVRCADDHIAICRPDVLERWR